MAINKVIRGDVTLLDVTDVGTTASNVLSGVTFIGNDGVKGVGTYEGGGGGTGISFADLYNNNLTSISAADISDMTHMNAPYFKGCTNLVSIELPEELDNIPDGTFWGCHSLEYVSVPYTVSGYLGQSAFNNCSALSSINLYDTSITNLGAYAFFRCGSLTSISLPAGLQNIQSNAFNQCTSLSSIELTDVQTIGAQAFQQCTALSEIRFPQSLTTIMSSAFRQCTALNTVHCQAFNPPALANNAFGFGVSLTSIYVPAEAIDLYKITTNWATYSSIMYAYPSVGIYTMNSAYGSFSTIINGSVRYFNGFYVNPEYTTYGDENGDYADVRLVDGTFVDWDTELPQMRLEHETETPDSWYINENNGERTYILGNLDYSDIYDVYDEEENTEENE